LKAIAALLALAASSLAWGGTVTGRISIAGPRPRYVKVGYVGVPASGNPITNLAGMTIGEYSGSVTCTTYRPREARLRWDPKRGLRFEHTKLPFGHYLFWARCDDNYMDWRVVTLDAARPSVALTLKCASSDEGDVWLVVVGKGDYNVRVSPLDKSGLAPLVGADVPKGAGWDADVKGGALLLQGMKAGLYRVDLRSQQKMGSARSGWSAILTDAGTWSVRVVAGKHREYKLTPSTRR